MYVLEELVDGARAYLVRNGYSESTVRHHEATWRRLASWCAAHAPNGYDLDVQQRFLEDAGLAGEHLTRFHQNERRSVIRLLEIAESGTLRRPKQGPVYVVPERLAPAYELYEGALASRGLKEKTIRGYLSAARHFLATCGASSPSELCARSVTAFVESMPDHSPQTRAGQLYVVRDLARTLAEAGMCGPSMAASMPLIPGHKHSSIPSAYSAEEVSALLGVEPSGRCPLRTRAMMLFAAVLGMRVGDIRSLRTSDVDWRLRTVTFAQGKTKVPQVLPMPDEVWLALADYLKNERPDIGGDRLFVTSFAPYHPIDSQESFHRSVARAFASAGVDVAGKHHGMHSLRHSAATNMLAEGTPYPTISAVLGHSSTNVTRRYLSIDVDSLRCLALEVPTCR
ncbi:MAG: tyrosine-type recombinase/integrase [Atopobiaceae bacterium]|nr:tyrosine-type recombinase/integrase [Atopobiaceae bacterium]